MDSKSQYLNIRSSVSGLRSDFENQDFEHLILFRV
jgi:hypothetical protein